MSSRDGGRIGGDACPGVSRPFTAVDGSIVRVRTAGQPVPIAALAGLLDVATTYGAEPDPTLVLTSRGALQLRGLPDPVPDAVRTAIIATGLVPSATHELARNIVASPLSGVDRSGDGDIRELVAELDAGLCASPELSGLPGRFLFALDDGRGDVVGLPFDLGIILVDADSAVVLAGDADDGYRVPRHEAVHVALELARRFLEERPGPGTWHVRELEKSIAPRRSGPTVSRSGPPLVGRHGSHAVVGVPLGLLTAAHLTVLQQAAKTALVTPWRTLVVPGAADALGLLARAGLVVDPADPWLRVHACTGLPGCARSAIDTRAIAHAIVGRMPPGSLPVHVSGCQRRCGTPRGDFIDVLAPVSATQALSMVAAR